MCGILGTFGRYKLTTDQFRKSLDTLTHRGPDGSGIFSDELCWLGNRRLSIIDLEKGDQPIKSPDGRYVVIFNGEIYNYKDLKSRWSSYQYQTDSDTEVILAGYEQHGPGVVNYLQGMFAFAIYDRVAKELFLARDPLGIKPLVYNLSSNGFSFASEIKALRCLPHFSPVIRPESVLSFFNYKYIPAPNTIYHNLHKLPAGHYISLTWQNGKLETDGPSQYWSPRYLPNKAEPCTKPEILRQEIKKTVTNHLVADVPIGMLLSGGLDSSTILWAMSEIVRPKTFTIGFKDMPDDPDLHYSQLIANHFKTDHKQIIVDATDYKRLLPKLVNHFDEPFADPAFVSNYVVAQTIRQHVKVALSGDGGDELFFGYRAYRAIAYRERLNRLVPNWLGLLSPDINDYIIERYYVTNSNRINALLKFPQAISPDPITNSLTSLRETYLDARLRIRMLEFLHNLPEYYLRKVDAMGMKASLEIRVPFLERSFVDKIMQVPASYHYSGSSSKILLKKTMKGYLPKAILNRSKKGFSRPWHQLFRTSLAGYLKERLFDPTLYQNNWFDRKTIERLVTEHQAKKANHAPLLWRLLVFAEWQANQSSYK